jgi:general secretion pathway protein N
MKRLGPLVALGVGAYLVFALITLPAKVVLTYFAPDDLKAAGVSGSAWHGRAQFVQYGVTNLGSLEWDVHPLALLTGRVRADVRLRRLDGFVESELTMAPGNRVTFVDLSAALPLSALPSNIAPGGWGGTVNAKLARLALVEGWPVAAEGTVEAINLMSPGQRAIEIGSYRITFPAGQASEDTLVGTLNDIGGPLQVSGTLQLKPDRSYVVEGLIATRPDAPSNVNQALRYLGPADAQGRRPFTFAGSI